MEEPESEPKYTAIDLDIWDNMLKDLDLPEDELMVAQSLRMFLPNIMDPKGALTKAVSVVDDTVCVNRLELMMLINAALDHAIETFTDEAERNPECAALNDIAADVLAEIDTYELVERICLRVDDGAFAEFLGRLQDAIIEVGEDELSG